MAVVVGQCHWLISNIERNPNSFAIAPRARARSATSTPRVSPAAILEGRMHDQVIQRVRTRGLEQQSLSI